MLSTAFHTGFLSDLPVLDAVHMIRAHGYEQAELCGETLPWGPAHVGPETSGAMRSSLAALGPYSSLCAHYADFGDPDTARNAAAIAWTVSMLDLAVDLDIAIVHVIAGERAERSALWQALEETMRASEARSLTLALEPVVNRLIATSGAALDAMAAVPGLKVNFDPSHLQIMEQDIPSATERLAAQVVHVHAKDAVGRPEDWSFVPLGQGEIDFVDMMHRLITKGFSGTVSVEHESHHFAGDTRGHEQVLRESREFLNRLLVPT